MAKYPGFMILNEIGTRADLARAYGVSERTIYRWLNKAAKESGTQLKVKQPTRPRMSTLEKFKGTRKQLAKKYGVSERTVYRWLNKAQLQGKEVQRRKPAKYPGPGILNDKRTNKQLATEFNVSERTISRWKRKARLDALRDYTDEVNGIRDTTPPLEDVGEPWEVPEPEDIGEPWEVPEPEDVGEPWEVPESEDVGEPWEVPEYDYYEDDRPEWDKLGISEETYNNLRDIIADITNNDLLTENSAFNNLEDFRAIQYMNKYIEYQYRLDPAQFYDPVTREERFDSDWVSALPIWGEEFEMWLIEQMETDNYEL